MVVVGTLGESVGSPDVSFSRLLVGHYRVPGVQAHGGDGVVFVLVAGDHLQLHEVSLPELQGEGLMGGLAGYPARHSPCLPQS